MKEQGSHKGPFSSRLPQEGRYDKQIEQDTRNTNYPMDQRFLKQSTNDGIGLFIFKKNLYNAEIQPIPIQLGHRGIGIDNEQLQNNCPF